MKIVFSGPESTGKTTLAMWLSQNTGYPLVPEIARAYLKDIGIKYQAAHVREIGLLQHFEERRLESIHPAIVCDTDLLTILVWLKVKFGIIDDLLYKWWKESHVDRFFLCVPDFPWVGDPLRENPHDRDELLCIYEQYLSQNNKPYILLSGSLDERKALINATLSKMIE